ncbi:3765_t:CDS:2, partial [Racocetra persica]
MNNPENGSECVNSVNEMQIDSTQQENSENGSECVNSVNEMQIDSPQQENPENGSERVNSVNEMQIIDSTQQETSFKYSERLKKILKNFNIKILDHSQFCRLKKCLGTGASADVYLGISQEKEYALKCIKTNLYMEDKKIERNLKKISRELELLHKVNHPNVVKFYGILQ